MSVSDPDMRDDGKYAWMTPANWPGYRLTHTRSHVVASRTHFNGAGSEVGGLSSDDTTKRSWISGKVGQRSCEPTYFGTPWKMAAKLLLIVPLCFVASVPGLPKEMSQDCGDWVFHSSSISAVEDPPFTSVY
ncbi:unnamed protein product [Dibothriocephalus latus]|uniref:Uncharacterized protein n=1 Tax=Dibothriocephalus latus TaxID=60516 RepID=A0A3P7R5P1_DIBLA|nr:unnamed protein product [Dibothriocephalus latus]